MQEMQAPGADSSSQGNACILSSFVRIKSEAAWGNREGKSRSLPEHLRASSLCSLVLRGSPAPAVEQKVSPHLPMCPFCFPVIPVQGCDSSLGSSSLQMWDRGGCIQGVSASPWSVLSLWRLYVPGFLQ